MSEPQDLNKQEEGSSTREPPPPPIPSQTFHFNKKMLACIEEPCDQNAGELDQLRARLVVLKTQLAVKGKQDVRTGEVDPMV